MSEEQSRLQVAVTTPVDQLTDEQKTLLTESWAALSPEEQATYAEFAPKEASSEQAAE